MKNESTIPPEKSIGHIHLKVPDLDRALEFYRDLLGFELTTMYGDHNQASKFFKYEA